MKTKTLFAVTTLFAAASCNSAPVTAGAEPYDLPRIDHNVGLWADPVTGCEYLTLYSESITPRMEYNNSYEAGFAKHRGCR